MKVELVAPRPEVLDPHDSSYKIRMDNVEIYSTNGPTLIIGDCEGGFLPKSQRVDADCAGHFSAVCMDLG